MIVGSLNIKNFAKKKNKNSKKYKIGLILRDLFYKKNQVICSLSKEYSNSYTKNFIKKLKRYKYINLIGMGGSILGAKAIYSFIKPKIHFKFIDEYDHSFTKKNVNKSLNLIISKSGNTLETIVNSNALSKKTKNILITENKNNYLLKFANKLRADVIHHNNFIGGRYSVLSEVGMLPAELMGLDPNKFRRLNNLATSKKFLRLVIDNASMMLTHVEKQNMNSIILNYDPSSQDLFLWYQQLVAESLGKKGKGILPIISTMPKDNHSLMQLYLDGFDKNFFTFFSVKEKNVNKMNNSIILNEKNFLKNKSLQEVKLSQRKATEKVFIKKLLPFRSFEIEKRDETTLGELFSFFILETILLGKFLGVNPYDQPSVELIKQETKKILI